MKSTLVFTAFFLLPIFVFAQKNIENLIKDGIRHHDEGEYKEAIAKFEEALDIDSKSVLANYEIANTLVTIKEYKKALKHIEKALDQKKSNQGELYMLKGTALDMLEKPKDAIKAYQKGIEAAPEEQLLYFNLGVTYAKQEQTKEAQTMLIESVKLKPSHVTSHFLLGQINLEQNHKTKALMALYHYLLLDNRSDRAKKAIQAVYNLLEPKRNETGGLNINLSSNFDADMMGSDLYIGMLPAVNSAIKKAVKDSAKTVTMSLDSLKNKADTVSSEAARFASYNQNMFKFFGETKEKGKGFWWSFYGDFYDKLEKAGHAEAFSYYISLPKMDKNVTTWLKENKQKFNAFAEWLKEFEYNTK